MSAPTLKRYRVVVIEWLSHKAIIEATDGQAAVEEGERLWEEHAERQVFRFDDSGLEGIEAEELREPTEAQP
jgi:hypothetical protein